LKVSGVLGELVGHDESANVKFTSEDGVLPCKASSKVIAKIPLPGESPEDVSLLVKWLTRAEGQAPSDEFANGVRFVITPQNIVSFLRLADKYDIPSLAQDVNVRNPPYLTKWKYYGSWFVSKHRITADYALWEYAAKLNLIELELECRNAAKPEIALILFEKGGIEFLLKKGVPAPTVTRVVRDLWTSRKCYYHMMQCAQNKL
jgi:hypothetical protein